MEVLLAGTMGAVLLTAVTYSTFQFGFGVTHLEEKAGVSDAEDTVLRVMTRDVRQAWWASVPDSETLELADPDGNITTYFQDGSDLRVRRPNGDEGAIYQGLSSITFEATDVQRLREGTTLAFTSSFYSAAMGGESSTVARLGDPGCGLSLAFTVPVYDEDLPGTGGTGEQLLAATLGNLSTPIHWVPGSAAQDITVSLFESAGPGMYEPSGSALDSVTVADSSLVQAVWNDGAAMWDKPIATSTIDLSSFNTVLSPGRTYTLVLRPTGDGQLLSRLRHHSVLGDHEDEIGVEHSPGAGFVPYIPTDDFFGAIPMILSGTFGMTTSETSQTVASVSITIVPDNRPSQTRSAALISQALSEDPWSGVIPNEAAP